MQHPVVPFDLMTDTVKTYIANLREKDDDLLAHYNAFFGDKTEQYEFKLQYSVKFSPPKSSGLEPYNVVACTNYYNRKGHEAQMRNPERFVPVYSYTMLILSML